MKSRRGILMLLLTALLLSATPAAQPPAEELGIVPFPRSIAMTDGTYAVPESWTIAATSSTELDAAATAMAFFRSRGTTVYLVKNRSAALRFKTVKDPALGHEGYRLSIGSSGVEIAAQSGAGLFYGIQTLEQILDSHGAEIPYADIVDAPRFAWRGIHLDVSRHFFPVSVVERYLDVAAHYKLNVFYWHLTDDQGWRIPIDRYPLLTKTGSCRAQTEVGNNATQFDGKPYCGFYTKAQIRDVVAYAQKRFITVVPEIEMPGHADAAIASYPQLACGAPHVTVRETWGVSRDILCPTDATFAFLTGVLTEVAALFPSRVIAIGGDEVPKEQWEHSAVVHDLMQREHLKTYDDVEGYFERRVAYILGTLGRRMAGWDEIMDGDVGHSAIVMAWHSAERGAKAAARGYDVVMSPDGPLYFDAYQGDRADEPLAIGGLSRLADVYGFEPAPRTMPPAAARHVIGVQANLWTEYIADPSYLFYMLLPRELALSEVAWSEPERRDWRSFQLRSAWQYAYLMRNHYAFRIPNPTFELTDAGDSQFSNVNPSMRTVEAQVSSPSATVIVRSIIPDAVIHYTTDGTKPGASSHVYAGPLHLALRDGSQTTITAVAVLRDGRVSTPTALVLRH